MTRKITLFLLLLSILLTGCGTGVAEQLPQGTTEYMVLIGEDPSRVAGLSDVDVLIIDASYFTREDLASMKKNHIQKIYSYLNIGSLEEFRECYSQYEKYTLGSYENWPDERWMDVSQPKWQEHILKESKELIKKGVDGFFIDNVDVYDVFSDDSIYKGLVTILSEIKALNKPVIINGGASFIRQYLESKDDCVIFDGVNQESVYTAYDFENHLFLRNNQMDAQYYTEYLDMLLKKGYVVYVLEYSVNPEITEMSYTYSKEHGYICYVSNNIELKIND